MPAPMPIGEEALAHTKPVFRESEREGVVSKRALCQTCDMQCAVVTESIDGQVVRVRSSDNPIFKDHICMKAIVSPKGFAHPDRILHPLKRVGERGEDKWEQVTWEEAMTDIASRLKGVIAEHGPEAWAVSTSQWNTGTDHGLGRRLMNHVGSPNWISGVSLCAGNTAAVSRFTYGWFPLGDFHSTKCIVLFGHNPRRHSWTMIYNYIQLAQARGAKLIVLDPRESSSAIRADIHLPLKAGSDAAMIFGWLKVIMDEELYDKKFVKEWTVGFEELRDRVNEFPLERVAKLTGCEPEMIQKAARMYATEGPSIIPWTPITDMQRNSTSAIRLQGCLRAICGYLDVRGGDTFQGLVDGVVNDSQIEMHEVLPHEQKMKQLGSDTHPAYTYKGQEAMREPLKRVWGHEYINQVTGCYMANPPSVFRAMAEGDPYKVKAFFALGNNAVMSYSNMNQIIKGLMNQELVVVQEHFMTPTAQLADYVLPGDTWHERPWLSDLFEWIGFVRPSEQSMEPMGEAKSTWEFWKLLANAMDMPEVVPWKDIYEFYDYRLAGLGKTFEEFCATTDVHFEPIKYKKYEKTGFATPSGKVELKSSILEDLGFDPLPYFREDPPMPENYPLMMFTGVREDPYFQTGGRHIPEMRARIPEPQIFISTKTAKVWNVIADEWVEVANDQGSVRVQVKITDKMPDDLIRVPHGWWKPEMERGNGKLSGALMYSDNQMCREDFDYMDQEQGIPHLKGIPCRINKLNSVTEEERLAEDAV
ncbi:molybdopterin-containing oxidoreductase family protein [Yoonia sediminilitoris]|uniref:Anaerobic selenocysteine-containing dehydrogenase n=1 Tax=Yoonia sediminilitoris TaxID=1286148 RepID=A0A2T6K6H2_9RHOB|nr:molybdopterin-dependent oxidoreductase [Yoonia sediminilitoris]PUB10271.1 anaerobic selenocysteine-containing dehydrogenase [Yoonia sediminilitoris]RCW89779.1 anaerobic selenocysteine-containing dehydrogenase [Yoonia sediminilitoris]